MGFSGEWVCRTPSQTTFQVLSQDQKDKLNGNMRNDAIAWSFIHQALDESIFPKLVASTTSKEAWDILEAVYHGSSKVKTRKLKTL